MKKRQVIGQRVKGSGDYFSWEDFSDEVTFGLTPKG